MWETWGLRFLPLLPLTFSCSIVKLILLNHSEKLPSQCVFTICHSTSQEKEFSPHQPRTHFGIIYQLLIAPLHFQKCDACERKETIIWEFNLTRHWEFQNIQSFIYLRGEEKGRLILSHQYRLTDCKWPFLLLALGICGWGWQYPPSGAGWWGTYWQCGET